MLSDEAVRQRKKHKVILMVELGDLREGIMPDKIMEYVDYTLKLKNITLSGIGTNLACFGGVKPDKSNMSKLTEIVNKVEEKYNIELEYVSGGNSANYKWALKTKEMEQINNIRLGESIFLGNETLYREKIPNMYYNAFKICGQVIEDKVKPSKPWGNIAQNAFGFVQKFINKGKIVRLLVDIGKQDCDPKGIVPIKKIEILGYSSDHLIINAKKEKIDVGDEVAFIPKYSALLAAMTSKFVDKYYV
jgi:predicted amino acid racemase